jgi:hypothetical protein
MSITLDELHPKLLVSELCKSIDPAAALQPGDCYDVIAGLDLPVYITTNYDDLLLHALRSKRKEPMPLLCPWHDSLHESAGETYSYDPTPTKPAVYYLHGRADVPNSIVVTEDDYLDFIVWITRQWKVQADDSHITSAVKRALAMHSLLFIGYSQNDWTFRVLMRSMRQTNSALRTLSVAVQLSPLDDDAAEVDQDKVADYLTRYFEGVQGTRVRLYWGTAQQFVTELKDRLAATNGGSP